MLDFIMISTRSTKRGVIEIYPKFIIPTTKKSTDLMIRGSDFYAVWDDELGLWSTDEADALRLIDRDIDKFAAENRDKLGGDIRVLHIWDADTKLIDSWHRYCKQQLRDSYHMLDCKLNFANAKPNKKDYASKRLPYSLEEGSIDAYDRMMSVLYSPEERHKLEWAIGSIVTGDSREIQKFIVLYGAAGTGKSTVLNIIEQLFDGYFAAFNAKALGSANDSFALEPFRANPLVAIQHDGDLSRIEDNTRLNSLVSHELMTVNEKFKSTYASRFQCFLFMGTNKPVRITDAKSGLLRRLIDVSPTGNKLSFKEYRQLTKQIGFELGAIAYHCKQVYLADPEAYNDYVPTTMLGASNDFYNYILDSYNVFKKENGVSLKVAWEMYKTYNQEAQVPEWAQYSKMNFKEELKNYFNEYMDRYLMDDGSRPHNYYYGFKTEQFVPEEGAKANLEKVPVRKLGIIFKEQPSIADEVYRDCPAQLANDDEKPIYAWDEVETKLSDIDTSKTHYVRIPSNHIVIDFDIPGEDGNKSFEKNLEEASKWPPTYAELSKSGQGIHLHYIYTGDPSQLNRVYADHIEVKVFTGKASLRRRLTKCNDIPIATISSGLPLKAPKGEKHVLDKYELHDQQHLYNRVMKYLKNSRQYGGTEPTVLTMGLINDTFEEAYKSGIKYDLHEALYNILLIFAMHSTHQSEKCLRLLNTMHLMSEDREEKPVKIKGKENAPLIFYDVEVFPNLNVVCWKRYGEDSPVQKWINPSPNDIEQLLQYRLVGFNNRKYDNHILYAILLGYDTKRIYNLSQKIISIGKGFFDPAYNISYTDIYDYSSKKQSLKKWEVELDIHHQELGLPWDKDVPVELWDKVAQYCCNDVIATEAVWDATQADFEAREILADLAGMNVNATTNSLSTKFIFEGNRNPQNEFNYRNMGEEHDTDVFVDPDLMLACTDDNLKNGDISEYTLFTRFDEKGRPVFPGYKYEFGKSEYRGEDPKEGGYVYAEPGMYENVALLDIASMHPSSIIAEQLFGERYTKRFEDIVKARIAIKHKDFDKARSMMNGKLAKYLDDESKAKGLAQALKIVINSIYGLTKAGFDNEFRDKRNVDNIVAKRGALFMINLKHEVQRKGFTVAHIKTDSIKIPNATPSIIQFVMDYGKLYGYNFEHEATYKKMCLVNDAVYVAQYDNGEWTATGKQFQVPYVFKTLFSHEDIKFKDLCETMSVTSALYLDRNETLPDGEHNYIFVGRTGSFCPIKPGCGGGLLLREGKDKDGNQKFASATGAKGYRWLESEFVRNANKENDIDRSYYDRLVNNAVDEISKYGDFEWFAAD